MNVSVDNRRCQTTQRVPIITSITTFRTTFSKMLYLSNPRISRIILNLIDIENDLICYRLTEFLRSCYRVCVGSPVSRNVSEKCPPVLPPSTGPRPILRCVVMWANGAPSPEKITLQTFMFIKKRRFNKCPVNFLISVTMQSHWWTLLVLLASNCRYLFSF